MYTQIAPPRARPVVHLPAPFWQVLAVVVGYGAGFGFVLFKRRRK